MFNAWKVKVAGRTFKLKELEDLCTKFLQYRIDALNLIHLLKNTIKYDTPDFREKEIWRKSWKGSRGWKSCRRKAKGGRKEGDKRKKEAEKEEKKEKAKEEEKAVEEKKVEEANS